MIYDITEGRVPDNDIQSVFDNAIKLRNSAGGVRKWLSNLRKDKLDITDLQRAWRDEGFPDSTQEIGNILRNHGFSKEEIKKVFRQVLGTQTEGNINPAIIKIAEYAKKHNLANDLKLYMQQEYGFKESYTHLDKVVIEDIRNIFSMMVQEERLDRSKLINDCNIEQYGRRKK